MTGILGALANVTRLGFDTAPLIYFVEAHATYSSVMFDVMRSIDQGSLFGVTSVLTLLELLTKPIQQGDLALQNEYVELLTTASGFEVIDITPNVAQDAARLRVRYRLKTPDALQIAVAVVSGCQAFITNDSTFRRVGEMRVFLLDDFLPSTPIALP
ncbi:PIN domain-containing protein [Myxococcota bacterium]|nr:PIN domain-containing protein [Myxococcota bacterium]